jgi:hypothetical protein
MKRFFMAAVALALCAPQPSFAHHSLSAYNITKRVQIEGTVKQFEWSSPHCWLILTVTDPQGKAKDWVLEAGTPVVNYRYGWKRDYFKPGDHLKVSVFPVHDGSAHGALESVTLPDGRVLEGPLSSYLKKQ